MRSSGDCGGMNDLFGWLVRIRTCWSATSDDKIAAKLMEANTNVSTRKKQLHLFPREGCQGRHAETAIVTLTTVAAQSCSLALT